MRNIKLTLEYDGTNFFGSQKQAHHRTVQGELEKALQKLFREKIKATFASRTDSGVHAEGQVANFRAVSNIPLSKIQLGLNSFLPDDLSVVKIEEMPVSFHAQFDAKRKTYQYFVWNSNIRPVLMRSKVFFFPAVLDLAKMKKAARLFFRTP